MLGYVDELGTGEEWVVYKDIPHSDACTEFHMVCSLNGAAKYGSGPSKTAAVSVLTGRLTDLVIDIMSCGDFISLVHCSMFLSCH
jgi:hypothetical protein